jgi:hypothetical protein
MTYTALIYFHGIGTPRRHEEMSKLADAIDQFSNFKGIDAVGRFRQIDVNWEASRMLPDEIVPYVKMSRETAQADGDTKRFRRAELFRLYEAYWSPEVAGGFSVWGVLWWFTARFFNPVIVLSRKWRTHQSLKLAALFQLAADRTRDIPEDAAQGLIKLYKDFEGWPARRKFPSGSFSEFASFISTSNINDKLRAKVTMVAQLWRRSFVWEQLSICFLSFTLAVFGVELVFVGFVVVAVLMRSMRLDIFATINETGLLPLWTPAPLWAAVMAIILLIVLRGLRHYVSLFLADVMFWAMRDEKDARYEKRMNIIAAAERAVLHVMADPQCGRIVVLGHSLGSAIAYNALIKIGQRSIAGGDRAKAAQIADQIGKISHFITFGSPIDRIHYFFDLHQSRYHRFNRIFDRLQGSAAASPFYVGGTQRVVWLNIWDDADPISSRLNSPRKKLPKHGEIIDVMSRSSHKPSQLSAHLNYLQSTQAMDLIFSASILNIAPLSAQKQKQEFVGNLAFAKALRLANKISLYGVVWLALLVGLNVLPNWAVALPISLMAIIWSAGEAADRKWPMKFTS